MIDYGTDLDCVDDLTPDMTAVTGQTVVLQAVARRFTTAKGSLLYDQTYGYGLREKLNTPANVGQIEREIEHEASQDERVANVAARVTMLDDNGNVVTADKATRLQTQLAVLTATGAFDLTLDVDSVSAKVLAQ